jgi:hypothetical protein
MKYIRKVEFNREKTKAVILYVLHRCPGIDSDKLEKLLYFIDFDYYELYEESFMGMTYTK